MRKSAIVAGTGFDGHAHIIRKHCRKDVPVTLRREPYNRHDPNAIAVYLTVPRFGGLLGRRNAQIGYIKRNTAKSLAKLMDSGVNVTARIKEFYAPDYRDFPLVTLEVTDEN